MPAFAAERMMDLEIEAKTGAPSPERFNHRNGYRERGWDTRAGRIELAIPKLRKGSYFPSFLEPRRTAEKSLAAVIQEAYVHGVSVAHRRWQSVRREPAALPGALNAQRFGPCRAQAATCGQRAFGPSWHCRSAEGISERDRSA